MKLVLQCAMCGTCHPVGTAVCSACHATGVAQLRLMFECPTCRQLGLNPTCDKCPPVAALDLDDELVVAEELPDEADEVDAELVLDSDEEDEKFVVVEDNERGELDGGDQDEEDGHALTEFVDDFEESDSDSNIFEDFDFDFDEEF